MELFVILAGTGLCALALWTHAAMRSGGARVQEVMLRSLADRRGGSLRRAGLGQGRELELPLDVGGLLRLRVRFEHTPNSGSPERMRVELRLQRVLPPLELSPEGVLTEVGKTFGMQDIISGAADLDRRFRIVSSEPEVVRSVLGPPLSRALSKLHRGQPGTLTWLDLQPDMASGTSDLCIRVSGWATNYDELRALIDACEQVGTVLIKAWDGTWLEAAHARGLAVGKLGQRGTSALVGVLDGIPLEARARRGPEGWRTEVTAWVDSLAGLRVVHRDVARKEGWDSDRVALGNPVLDMLVAARARDSQALRLLLTCEAVTEELLPVVHGRPGSELRHDSVRLLEQGRLTTTLGDAIDDALALAKAVRAARGAQAPQHSGQSGDEPEAPR